MPSINIQYEAYCAKNRVLGKRCVSLKQYKALAESRKQPRVFAANVQRLVAAEVKRQLQHQEQTTPEPVPVPVHNQEQTTPVPVPVHNQEQSKAKVEPVRNQEFLDNYLSDLFGKNWCNFRGDTTDFKVVKNALGRR